MVQSLKGLLSKCEDPHSILITHFEKPSTVAHTCDPSAAEAETGGALGWLGSQPALSGELKTSDRRCFNKNKVENA